jgi:hypothetical protein
MMSSSCQHDPLIAADLSQNEGEALPTALVIREYILNVSFIAARVRLVNLIGGGSLVPASIDAYACGLPKLARRGPDDALPAAAASSSCRCDGTPPAPAVSRFACSTRT